MENTPRRALKTDRSFWAVFFLSLITFGIYGLVVYTQTVNDLNTLATPHDGKKTMHYLLLTFLLGPLSLGIVNLVWGHNITARIHDELVRRGLRFDFTTGTYWGWNILGSFIFVGPFIYGVKFFNAMNLLCGDYNERG